MAWDALSFVLLCVVTRRTLRVGVSSAVTIPVGVLLVALGIGIKRWAARSLDPGAYYWRDFFAPDEARLPDPPGPYRFFEHPMYTVGYLHAYGFALVCGSAIGLAAAAFDQIAILAFARLVERPHFERIMAGRRGQGPSSIRSL
jgi:protein-S-isoprenylcysteine O-methyltransferase Ste14